jgi:hypothetical protein
LDLDIHPLHGEKFILSGGKDGKAVLFNREQGKIVKKIEGANDPKKKGAITVSRFVPG